jgi:Zn2+/Cd2+-exporting ATPase
VSAVDLLSTAAGLESRSEHPIGRAITAHAQGLGVRWQPVPRFHAAVGLGADGVDHHGRTLVVGSQRLLDARGITMPASDGAIERLRAEGRTLVFVAVDGTAIGAMAIADRPRESAKEAIELLRRYGISRVAMLTGDQVHTARTVAGELGLDEFHAALLPEQKHDVVRQLRSASGAVLMVGDGVNDAPALAAADVGVAMGAAASDAALETADVALLSDELLKLPYAVRLARATLRNIRMNVVFSLILKAAFLLMAVGGTATLWMAVLADTGASVLVVANALRLLRAK